MSTSTRSRGWVRRGFRRNGPLRVVGRSVRRLRLVGAGAWKAGVGGGRHRGVLGGASVVAANLFVIFPNDVFSGWGGSGRLIVHTKAVVPASEDHIYNWVERKLNCSPVCVVDKAALVGFVERTKHSFHISCVLVSRLGNDQIIPPLSINRSDLHRVDTSTN